MENESIMLTTVDNPFNPFHQFEQWRLYDVEHGYNSCELIDRFAETSDDLSDEENNLIIEQTINEIIKYDSLNIFAKITRKDKTPLKA